ncbi:MAG: hypothetical protein R3D00_27520 [Bacteroidia bacterium]
MTKSVKITVIIIGVLSIISGVYLAFSNSAFWEYFTGIFLGITLIGSILLFKEKPKSDEGQ